MKIEIKILYFISLVSHIFFVLYDLTEMFFSVSWYSSASYENSQRYQQNIFQFSLGVISLGSKNNNWRLKWDSTFRIEKKRG